MIHFSEHTLELLVLNSPRIEARREEIQAHLEACKGCSELYAEIAEFYRSLSGPEALPEPVEKSGTALRLSPSYGKPVLQMQSEDRPAVFAWVRQNRKAVTSVGTFTIVAAVAMFFAVRFGSGAPTAHHAIFDEATHAALIADRSGNVLFSIALPRNRPIEAFRNMSGIETVLIDDLDGDRIPEIITWLPFDGDGVIQAHWVRVYRSDGTLAWKAPLGESLAYGDRQFGNTFQVKGVQILSLGQNGGKELFVGVAHEHSPYIFYRLSGSGEIIGQYRLMGHVTSFLVRDGDDNGTPEVYFAGVQDNGILDRDLYAGVLDPSEIIGTSEATFTHAPGFGVPPSKAEISVARFPHSYLNAFVNQTYSNVARLVFRQDGLLSVVVNEYLAGSGAHAMWMYTFSKELIPIQVDITDAVRSVHRDLQKRGEIRSELSSDITDAMLRSITFWNGTAWQSTLPSRASLMTGLGKDVFNPARTEFRGTGIDLLNGTGRIVGRIDLDPEEVRDYASWSRSSRGIERKVVLADANGDGLKEVLFYKKGKVGGNTLYTLECRSSDGSEVLWSKPFVWDIEFPGKPDDVVPYYTAGDLYLDDVDNDGAEDLIITAGNLSMFPCLVLRLDPRTGEEKNAYLHIGHLQAQGIIDLDGDGTKEILLGGVANSYKEAAFVVLNGSDFSGVSPHTEEYRPVGWAPGNERAYFRIHQTIVGDQFWRTTPNNSFQQLDLIPPSRQMHAWIVDFSTLAGNNTESSGSFAVHFSYGLKVIGVSTGSLFDAAAERLYRTGELNRKIDTSYWEDYLSSIKQWNGVTWYTERVKLRKDEVSMR